MEKSTLSIKETLSITFRTLKILFHAAPGGIAFLGILSTIAGVCPFLTLILSRAFLDSLARACGQQAFEMEIIWLLFFLFLTNMMLSVVNNLSILLKSDVSGRISLLVNAQVLEKCVHLPMSQYDNETTYNRIRFTSEQTSIRCTNLINTFFLIVQCLISFASVVCVLVSFNGIIVIASVVASIPLFFVNKYVSSFWYKISVGRVEKQRYSDALRDLMLRNDNIKELKLFGSLSYLKSRILNQQTDFFREDQMNRKKFCKIDTAQKAANDFVILLLKLWIIILGIKQRATLGTINLYTSSLDQIQSAIFSFCTQLNTFYEQALYLESLFDLFDMQTEDENCGTPCAVSWGIAVWFAGRLWAAYPLVSVRSDVPVTGRQLEALRSALRQEDGASALVPAFWSQAEGSAESRWETCGITAILYCGEYDAVYPAVLLEGRFPAAQENGKCAVSTAAAWQLWGSEDVLGQELEIEGDIYRVCGLFRSSASLALCGESLDHGFSNIEFWGGYAAPPVETVQQLLRAAGIAQQVTLYFPFPWMAALTAYALCPAGLVLLAAARTLGGRVRRGCPKETCWFVLGGAFLLALVLPALLRLLPPWITPARWSDFSYWGGLLPAVGKAIETGFSLNPCAKDVLAKWNTLGLLIAATLANAAAGKLMLSRQQKNSTNL